MATTTTTWCGGDAGRWRRRCGKNGGDGGSRFGVVLEWFWEHKIHEQNTEKNVWKMEDDEFILLFKK